MILIFVMLKDGRKVLFYFFHFIIKYISITTEVFWSEAEIENEKSIISIAYRDNVFLGF